MLARTFIFVFSLYIVPFIVLSYLVNDYFILFFCQFFSFGVSLVVSHLVILFLCLYFFRSKRFRDLEAMAEDILFNKDYTKK